MAYIPRQIPKEEENQFGRTGETTPNPAPPQSSGSAGTGSEGGGGVAPGVASSTQFGSSAAKLSDYLKANEPQVQEFGNKIAGNLTGQYNQTMGNINSGYGNFNQQINQGWVQPNQELTDQAAANPTDFVKNEDNVRKFQSLYNNNYTGPQNFESSDIYSNLNKDVNKAVEDSALVGSFSGLGSYLDNYMGTAGNTRGMNTLDTALLQRSPGARQAIESAAQPFQNLSGYLGGKAGEANQNIAGAKEQAAGSREALQNRFTGEGGIIPTFQSDLNNRVNQARQQATNRSDTFRNDILNYNPLDKDFTNEELISMGVDPVAWTKMMEQGKAISTQYNQLALGDEPGVLPEQRQSQYNTKQNLFSQYGQPFSLANYLTSQQADVAITPENFASREDYDRATALAQLTGQNSFLNGSNINQAGTYNPNLTQFDITNSSRELRNKLSAADNQVLDSMRNLPGMNLQNSYVNKDDLGKLLTDVSGRNYGNLPQTPDPVTPPGPDEPRLRINEDPTGQLSFQERQQWWDGQQWVQAPPEIKREGDKTYQFDYNTGKYNEVPSGTGVMGTPVDVGDYQENNTPILADGGGLPPPVEEPVVRRPRNRPGVWNAF